jgi:metal-responsive CopG/Arc/MetJ family transcriptional regulator
VRTIQVVVDAETLRAADREARRAKVNRSELFRRAVRSYLQRAHARALEDKHRAGYERHPETAAEFGGFEASWPEK